MNFLKRDLKDEAKILRKRLNEEERKKRIFDPRARIIGVDVKGLNQQLEEKCKKSERERRDNEAYERRKLQEDRLSVELERNLERKRKEVEKRLIEFRQVYQKPSDRREFDLNDPEFLKKSRFERNRFDGEDETQGERAEQQKEQTRAWLLQQMAEKRRIHEEKRLAESKMVQLQLAVDARSRKLSELEEQCRKKLEEATLQFNMLTAEEKAAEKRMTAAKQAQIEAQEVRNWVTGSFLTEDPSVARSAFGPNRVIAFMYKGEPPEKQLITKKEQEDQIKQTRARESQATADKQKWEQYEKSIQTEATKKLEKLMQEQRELDHQVVTINSQLAEQHKRREAKNNDISDLYPTSEFFQQFNRSTY